MEYTKSETGSELGDASSSITSRGEKLKALASAFIDTIIIP